MLRKLTLTLYMMSTPIAAETIGNVEFNLETLNPKWKLANTTANTLFFVPDTISIKYSKESFVAARIDKIQHGAITQQEIEGLVNKQLPDFQHNINILESTPQSAFFEWSVIEHGREVLHAWTRAFFSPHETIMLMYQTELADSVEQVRPIWTNILKAARQIPLSTKD